MKSKIKIADYPKDSTPAYSHMTPLVDFLLANGNLSAEKYLWGNNRTGYFCHLLKDIDFSGLEENFDFPDSMVINREKQIIDCLNTYTIICKPL